MATANTTGLEDIPIAELKEALAAAKARKREQDRIAREERRLLERAEREAKIRAFREQEAAYFVGPTSEWLSVSNGYNSVELTVYEGTVPQSGIVLSKDDAIALRDILNEIL